MDSGLISMRGYKLESDDDILFDGAFAKKLEYITKTSDYYDSESYLALSRLLKFKKQLIVFIDQLIYNGR